jgi:transcriptional repressor NrdR
MLVKRDGRREEFQRDKLWSSVTKACAKRPLQMGSIDKLVQDIEATLVDSGRAEMASKTIGEMVMERLKKLDRVAYIRYASVYRDFKDIETFKEEIDSLLEPPQTAEDTSGQLSFLEEQVLPVRRRRRGRPQKASLPGPS